MEKYESPAVLATYTVEELVQEATVCVSYGPGGDLSGAVITDCNLQGMTIDGFDVAALIDAERRRTRSG